MDGCREWRGCGGRGQGQWQPGRGVEQQHPEAVPLVCDATQGRLDYIFLFVLLSLLDEIMFLCSKETHE